MVVLWLLKRKVFFFLNKKWCILKYIEEKWYLGFASKQAGVFSNRTHINFVKQLKLVECCACAPDLSLYKFIYSFEEPYLFSPEPIWSLFLLHGFCLASPTTSIAYELFLMFVSLKNTSSNSAIKGSSPASGILIIKGKS